MEANIGLNAHNSATCENLELECILWSKSIKLELSSTLWSLPVWVFWIHPTPLRLLRINLSSILQRY